MNQPASSTIGMPPRGMIGSPGQMLTPGQWTDASGNTYPPGQQALSAGQMPQGMPPGQMPQGMPQGQPPPVDPQRDEMIQAMMKQMQGLSVERDRLSEERDKAMEMLAQAQAMSAESHHRRTAP